MELPTSKKKIKQKIAGYRRALKKEYESHGMISDGYGKRYLLFYLYLLLNDLDKAEEYIEWFEDEFPADVGEPAMFLCWALLLHRMGKEKAAENKLAMLMLSNLYLIPYVLGEENIEVEDMWHGSNFAEIDYIDYTPEEIYSAISFSELEWIEELYDSDEFVKMRNTHIGIHYELQHEKDTAKRKALIDMSSVQWLYLYGMPIDVIRND